MKNLTSNGNLHKFITNEKYIIYEVKVISSLVDEFPCYEISISIVSYKGHIEFIRINSKEDISFMNFMKDKYSKNLFDFFEKGEGKEFIKKYLFIHDL